MYVRIDQGFTWLRRILIALILIALISAGYSAGAAKAQPYGGCKEAFSQHLLHTPGARDCRRAGWVVGPNVLINPNGLLLGISSRVTACRHEDSRRCIWDAQRRTNHRGHSYYADRTGRLYYLRVIRGPLNQLRVP